MSKYFILSILVKRLIPSSVITDSLVSWLSTLLYPISNLNVEFGDYAEDLIYFESFNGQVIYLEHLLNNQFDQVDRSIYIENNIPVRAILLYNSRETHTPVFVYNESESQSPLYLYNNIEILNDVDFIVMKPALLAFDEPYWRSLINHYRIAGKRYSIESF